MPFYLDEDVRTELIKDSDKKKISPRELLHQILRKIYKAE